MGGFGALRNGMKYAETFSHIAAYSSGIHFFEPGGFFSIAGEHTVFGDLEEAAKTDKSHYVVLEELRARIDAGEVEAPRFYMSCGTEDSLFGVNVKFRDILLEDGFDVTWDEEPSGHEWEFWDSQVKKTLEWLPLGTSEGGMGSGNVSKDL